MADWEAGGVGVQDLGALDRDVARAVARLAEWRAALRVDVASHADDEPLESVRRVAGQSTWLALERLDVPEADRPLRDGLRQWVYFLLQARVGRAEDVEWARAEAETANVDRGEVSSRVTWSDAWRGAVAAPTAPAARPWLDATGELGPRLASVAARRASRRVEVATRLGVDHPSAPLVGVPYSVLRATAAGFLEATDDLWAAVYRDALRDGGGIAAVLVTAVARDAGDGWPARLTATALRDLLRHAFDGAPLDLPALPSARGAASFARALYMLGFALRSARPSASVPYALAREPAFVAAHRLGFVVGSLPADPVFQMRALGVGRRVAAAQARALARTGFLEARLHALRVLLGDDAAPAPRDLFDEVTARTFGRSIDPGLRGAWPLAREDEPARWLALLGSVRASEALRNRFDVDWFRNPRAWHDLRAVALAREPADEGVARAGVGDLVRVLEAALG
jgi:hypothetical protein